MRKLFILAMALILLLVCGCGSKDGNKEQITENLDASYYRRIVMLPDGRLLCSLEVDADKVANAGSVLKVEKKEGKIKKITALYDGEKRAYGSAGEIFCIVGSMGVTNPEMGILTPSTDGGILRFIELEIVEEGGDLIYKHADQNLEIMHFNGGSKGKPSGEDKGRWQQFKYDEQGRCISRTSKSKRVEYGYEGDSLLPVSLVTFNEDGKKGRWDITMQWDEYNRLVCVMLKENYIARFESIDYVSASSPEPEATMAEQVRFFYDENNPKPFSVRGYSFSGIPVVSTETGVHEYAYRYDDKGNMISVESLGIHGQPVMAIKFDGDTSHEDSCCSAVRYVYDERGRRVATATYGADGRPVNSYNGYAEVDTPFWKEYKSDTIYFGALGQPVDCKIDKKIPAYHRKLGINLDDVKKWESHFFDASGNWLGVQDKEFSESIVSKDDECEKRALEPAKAIILDTMGLTKFTHEDKKINEQPKAVTATSATVPATAQQSEVASSNTKPTYSMEPKTPEQKLQEFHQNITNKNYRKAYTCLSKDFQSAMPYDDWTAGFSTTVSSTVSDVQVESQSGGQTVLTYTLKAVDSPGGTQYFRGTAVFIWTDSQGWKIDDITNKPM